MLASAAVTIATLPRWPYSSLRDCSPDTSEALPGGHRDIWVSFIMKENMRSSEKFILKTPLVYIAWYYQVYSEVAMPESAWDWEPGPLFPYVLPLPTYHTITSPGQSPERNVQDTCRSTSLPSLLQFFKGLYPYSSGN